MISYLERPLYHILLDSLTNTVLSLAFFKALEVAYNSAKKTNNYLAILLSIVLVAPVISFLYYYNTQLLPIDLLRPIYRDTKQRLLCLSKLEVSLIIITLLISPISWLLTEKKNKKTTSKLTLIYLAMVFSVFLLCICKSIISFFIVYEMFLLLSFFMVMSTSSNKRSKLTSLYFLVWTQLGSFLVFLGVILITTNLRSSLFSHIRLSVSLNYSNNQLKLAALLFFIGFGIKIPVWPFHFWLTKTHVEANTGFSIFLSGILVKIGVLGLFKFSSIILSNYSLNGVFLAITIYSMADAALKLPSQTDLKKLVAYATIFEMNFLIINLFFNSGSTAHVLSIFVAFHSCISGVFFIIVDYLYKRSGTRVVGSVKSIQEDDPILAFLIGVAILLFTGLPLTAKFVIEVSVISTIWSWSPILTISILIFTYIFNLFFLKAFISVFFGKKETNHSTACSSKKEVSSILYLFAIILLLPLA